MQEIIPTTWLQCFDSQLEMNSLHVLLVLLGAVLVLESSFVFLPLSKDGLVLFVGDMVGLSLMNTAFIALFIGFSAKKSQPQTTE